MTINTDELSERARKEFGERVRFRRVELGLTQDALSERVSRSGAPLTRDKIAKIERGTRPTPIEELVILAHYLDMRPGALLGDADDMDAQRVLRLAEQISRQRGELLRAAEELEKAQNKFRAIPTGIVDRVRDRLGPLDSFTLEDVEMSSVEYLATQEEDGDDPDDVRDRRDDR